MKKLILPIVVLLLVFTLAGCGGGGGSKNSATVSGDASLNTEIISLLNTFATGFVTENSTTMANCLDFPYIIQNDYSGTTTTFYSYSDFINNFKFSESGITIDVQKYNISNAHFQDNGNGTGTVTYNLHFAIKIPGLGSGAENDLIELELKKVTGSWKIKKYRLISSTAAKSSVNKPLTSSIFGSIDAMNE